MSYEEELAKMSGYGDRSEPQPGEQKSVEWLMSRLGHCTASNFKHVMDFTGKGKPSAKRIKYLMDVLVERLSGVPAEHFVTSAMEHGTAMEPEARRKYEVATGSMVVETGFIHHTTIKWCGGSPDGYIDDDGLIEIKAPNSVTHINTLLTEDVSDYVAQCQGLMWVCNRKWVDLCSYDPRLPDGLNLFVKRIPRDDDYIAELAAQVAIFLDDVSLIHAKLLAIAAKNAPPIEQLTDQLEPLEL